MFQSSRTEILYINDHYYKENLNVSPECFGSNYIIDSSGVIEAYLRNPAETLVQNLQVNLYEYRAECMIPFSTYSIKMVYVITFMAYKVYARV